MMILMKTLLPVLFLILTCFTYGQKAKFITESDLPGYRMTRSDTFSGDALYGFVDGGADLYLEYGFRKLWVREFTRDRDKITVELYRMQDPPSAFGIYSVSVSRCMQMNRFGSFSCTTPNQIAVAYGPFFINVLNGSGTQEGISLCEQVVTTLMTNNPQESWYVPAVFQQQALSPYLATLRYFTGPIGIMNVLPAWSDLFDNVNFNMYTVKIASPSFSGIFARIVFNDDSDVRSFQMKAGLTDPRNIRVPVMTSPGVYRSWLRINDTRYIFLEGSTDNVKITDYVPAVPDITW
jgi:hypothetical protein